MKDYRSIDSGWLVVVLLRKLEEFKEENEMARVISILSVVLFLATICTIALAAPVPGAVLYLDARDNPSHPDAWKNLGAAGGELPPMHTAPELEEGPIKIPHLRIDERMVKYYTAKKMAHMFGIKLLDPALSLEDWTIEFLLRRNGNLFGEEHQLAGVNTLPEGRQGLRLGIGGAGEFQIGIYAEGADAGLKPDLILEEGVWMWVAIAAEDKKNIRVYQNGIKVNEYRGVDWDDNIRGTFSACGR